MWNGQFRLAESWFDCVPVVWRCFSTNGFDAQGPGCIIKQQTARHESHALQRYRVLDFVDQFGFLHSEHCHGRARKEILNIFDVWGVPGHGLSIPRNRIWMRSSVRKISRKQHNFRIFDNFEEEPEIKKSLAKLYSLRLSKIRDNRSSHRQILA